MIQVVDKNDLMEEHNNNASNVRNKIAKIDNVGSKIDKKQLQNIDFRETLFKRLSKSCAQPPVTSPAVIPDSKRTG